MSIVSNQDFRVGWYFMRVGLRFGKIYYICSVLLY